MPGVFITRGSSLRIPSFTIDLDNMEATNVTPEIGLDVYPLWLRSAITQARQAQAAATELDVIWDGSGKDPQGDVLERELCASMSALVSSAAALDAFYGSVIDRCPAPTTAQQPRRKRARERIILSTFQQRFALKSQTVAEMRQPLKDVFRFRHIALHAHGRPELPVEHPRLNVGMSRKHVIFRAENATSAAAFALTVISHLATRPNARYPVLRKHCGYARDWLDPLVTDWETDHPPLGLPRPLAERSRPQKANSKESVSP